MAVSALPVALSNSSLLEFEKEILLEVFNEDGLLVMARGLGIDRIYTSVMRLYCHSSYFVLMLNIGLDDPSLFLDQLRDDPVSSDLHILDSTSSPAQRNSVYKQGGLFIVTSRILVIDLLSNNLPCESVTGLLVFNAHAISDASQERFIIRLFRERNDSGFIKAFSDDPMAFTTGICEVEHVMKCLFVRQLFVWPRFHWLVHKTLEMNQPNVEEITIEMTAKMKGIQLAIFELLQICLQELKRNTKYLDPQMMTTENAMFPWFHRYIRRELNAVWNEIGYVSRQLVFDLKVLQNALISLYRFDSVAFATFIKSIRWGEGRSHMHNWVLTNAADRMFALSHQRLYANVENDTYDFEKCSEENVKFSVLRSLIKNRCSNGVTQEKPNLIISLDESSSMEIKRYLQCENGEDYVRNKLSVQDSSGHCAKSHKSGSKRKESLAFGQMFIDHYLLSNDCVGQSSHVILDIDDPPTAICPLSSLRSCQISLLEVLKKCRPSNVILSDSHLHYVRQIELYCALYPEQMPTIYCLTYLDSAEEQIYLASIQKEKAAMDRLIKKKSNIVIADDKQLLTTLSKHSIAVSEGIPNSRVGGSNRHNSSQPDHIKQQIIVDLRELRSELPSMLYKLNIELVPVTLEVGDYVLTPDICVERKSLSDLIGSMTDGRLYTQILMMSRHYEKPVLLIEYNCEDEKFSLKDRRFGNNSSTTFSSTNICSKLVLLTIHFPRMRIIWSSCPSETAEIFNDLKDLLLKVPGVTFRNLKMIMDRVRDIKQLSTLTEEELAAITESKMTAKQIYGFLNATIKED